MSAREIPPFQIEHLKRGFMPLDPASIGTGEAAEKLGLTTGWQLALPKEAKAQIVAWAAEYERLVREIDRLYETGQAEAAEGLEERAYWLEDVLDHALEEAAVSEEDLKTGEDTKLLMDLEGEVADLYHEYLTEAQTGARGGFMPGPFDAERGITTREGMFAETLRHVLQDAHIAHGGEPGFHGERSELHAIPDQQLVDAAADCYHRKRALVARYKRPRDAKDYPAVPKIPPRRPEANPPPRGQRWVLEPGHVACPCGGKSAVVRNLRSGEQLMKPHMTPAGSPCPEVAWQEAVERTKAITDKIPPPRRPQANPRLRRPHVNPSSKWLPQDAWSKKLRAVANAQIKKLYDHDSATSGGCWIVGDALQHLHGGKLETIYEEFGNSAWCDPLAHHVVVELPDGRLLDGDGLHTWTSMLDKAMHAWGLEGQLVLGEFDAEHLERCSTEAAEPGEPRFKKLVAALKAVGPPPAARKRAAVKKNGDSDLRWLERAALASGAPSDWWAFQAERRRQGQSLAWDRGTWVGVYRAEGVAIVTPVRGVAVIDGHTYRHHLLRNRWHVVAAKAAPNDWGFDDAMFGDGYVDRDVAMAAAANEAEWRIALALDAHGLVKLPPPLLMSAPAVRRPEPVS